MPRLLQAFAHGLAESSFLRGIRGAQENIGAGLSAADNEMPLRRKLRQGQPPLADARMLRPHDADEILGEKIVAIDITGAVDPADGKIDPPRSQFF